METILGLRSAALLVPYKRTGHPLPLACHLSRHLDFVGRIRFPRSVLLPCHHRSVSCSATAPPPPPLPPKNREENGNKDCVGSGRKAEKVAAISAAVALACALCAVYLRRGPPIPKLLGRTACIAASISPMDLQVQNTKQGKSVVQETRDVVWEILFKDASYLIERGPTTSTLLAKHCFNDYEKYELAISMTLIFIAKKDFHSAKTVMSKAIQDAVTKEFKDARPFLLMAVIDMMLAVEATLRLDRNKDVCDLIASAKTSIEKLFELKKEGFGGEPPDTSSP